MFTKLTSDPRHHESRGQEIDTNEGLYVKQHASTSTTLTGDEMIHTGASMVDTDTLG